MVNEKIDESVTGWALMQGLREEEVQKIFDAATKRMFRSGESLCRQGEIGESMFLILFGRVRMSVRRDDGNEHILNVLQQGDHFGELTLLIGGPRTASATAVMDTAVLELAKPDFYKLLNEIPGFSINLSRTIGGWLRGELSGKIARDKLTIIGLIRTSPITDTLTQQVVDSMAAKNKKVEVFTDRLADWQSKRLNQVHALSQTEGEIETAMLRLGLTEAAEHCDHVFVDVAAAKSVPDLLMQCQRVWWFAEQETTQQYALVEQVNKLLQEQPELASRLQIVWVQPRAEQLAAAPRHDVATMLEDLRCQYDRHTKELRRADLARYYHAANGIHLGLALGGGGARGLAHIGVLAALQENDLFFDRVAGTSAGAIIAAGYGAGFDHEYMLNLFSKEMTPPKWIGYVPKGTKWHLMSLFRYGLVEPRFRRYLQDYTFDQLLLPVHMVCVDLISGEEVIRSSGDVVNGVLESINHPLFGRPIFRDGTALVDGGVLINVPSSVLRKQHVDYVVSVDVGTKLSANFGKNNAETKAADMKPVGYFSTLNRVLDVSHRGLAKLHMSESDYLIKPDTSSCPFEDFTRGPQLFEIGYKATMEIMPELKQSYEEFVEQK